ncbi:unnamed protein product [Didymodactylos carnosus]|uniref:Uncharacterized protein n=1 Tax=Didymodactylos carnosus TaxID=1234261 RepID=A0A814ML91_9BILA|nr:unnamed protein product [Didymodactylos carnosus]CAF1080926.1 unnamed protein product [Didymodactylos carnosus]CAF3547798.1 unnamed protein product [Didymodactylos carnosus]CAF3846847.1 unnamed protein product [Didymodactylos carnosus]
MNLNSDYHHDSIKQINDLNIIQVLNNFVEEWHHKNSLKIQYEILNEIHQNVSTTLLSDPSVLNHDLFFLIIQLMTDMLNKWSIMEQQEIVCFKCITDLLYTIINKRINELNLESFKNLLLNNTLVQSIKYFVDNSLSTILDIDEKIVFGVSNLLLIFIELQYGRENITNNPNLIELAESIVKWVSSIEYFNILINLNETKSLTVQENFLVISCPHYFSRYRGKNNELLTNSLCDLMLQRYEQILSKLTSILPDWNESIMTAVRYMCYALRQMGEHSSTRQHFTDHLTIIDSILLILNSSQLQNKVLSDEDNFETKLLYAAIWVLSPMGKDPNLSAYLKDQHDIQTFHTLTNAKCQALQMYAYKILVTVMNEDDIKNLTDPRKITAIFIDFIRQAIASPLHSSAGGKLQGLLFNLKGKIESKLFYIDRAIFYL